MKSAYLGLLFKKAARVYPLIVAISLAVILAVVVFSALTIQIISGEDEGQKYTVGLVGETDENYLGIGAAALTSFDSLGFSLDFYVTTEEEAITMLKNGELSGYIVVPDGFVQGIADYENKPLRYVIFDDFNTFNSIIFSRVVEAISGIITESQTAMISLEKIASENGISPVGDSGERLNLRYIDFILRRDDSYEIEKIKVPGSISIPGYYICSGIMLILLMWGISCSPLLKKGDRSLDKLLRSKGVSPLSQVLSEYFCFITVTILTFALFFFLFLLIADSFGFSESGPLPDPFSLTLRAVPAILAVSSIHFLLYEAFGNGIGVLLIQFSITITAGYISGCFYPDKYFPRSVRTIAMALPWGRGLFSLREAFLGTDDLTSALILLTYALAALFLSVLLRRKEVRS